MGDGEGGEKGVAGEVKYDNTTIRQYDNTTIRQYDNTRVRGYEGTSSEPPNAWRRVLQNHPDLKIFFAHFGGQAWEPGIYPYRKGLESHWVQEIMSLIKEYKNVYTDISYFKTGNGFSGYTSEFKIALRKFLLDEELSLKKEPGERETSVLDRILWGTDWYMTEIENLFYDNHCRKMKNICDDNCFEGAWKTLYLRFTMINPLEFFRIGKIAENFSSALKKDLEIDLNERTILDIDNDTEKMKKICAEANRFKKWLNER